MSSSQGNFEIGDSVDNKEVFGSLSVGQKLKHQVRNLRSFDIDEVELLVFLDNFFGEWFFADFAISFFPAVGQAGLKLFFGDLGFDPGFQALEMDVLAGTFTFAGGYEEVVVLFLVTEANFALSLLL